MKRLNAERKRVQFMLMKDPRQKTPYNMMEEYFMTPSAEMERKYNFFYQPYNYAA